MAKSPFFLYRIVPGHGAGRRLRAAAAAVCAVSLAALAVGLPGTAVPALASGGPAQLQPDAGQFFPVPPVRVADTRYGTGGVPAQPLAASGGTITFTVTGAGQVPASGVSDVYVVINAISPTANGCLNDYAADLANPNICTVSFEAGQNMSNADIVQVSSSGQVSVTNDSTGTADVVVSVMGYVQDFTAPAAGETYVPVPQAQIVDTRSGLGAPQAQVPAGGSLTVQVGGHGGVPSDAAGAALFIGAANATATGWVSAYPAGGTASSLAILSYQPGRKARDLYFGAVSSSGQLTLVNQGSAPVDLMVGVEGYLVSPTATEAGSEYQAVPELRIVDTRDGTGGVPATPIPAGGSITFSATGVDDVPASGVSSVAESVAAIGPAASGYLSVYPAGGTDPDNPGVNFTAGDYQDNDMAAAVSSSGRQTITNHSSGTVDVVVSARGYYLAPVPPAPPFSVSASVSGSSATVTWLPPGIDGGAAITGYTVTASPDNARVTVAGTATQATLTGLAHAAADSFAVTASNAAGASEGASYAPVGVISGKVLSPGGQPVAGAPVMIDSSDVPGGDPAGWTPASIGTTTTDANGIWTFTVPPYSGLPAGAQAAADNNGGWLNMDVTAAAYAVAYGITYDEGASGSRSALVGTSAQPSGPVTIAAADASAPVMTATPDQADLSAQDTTSNEQSTWTYQHAPALYDSSGNIIGSQDPTAAPPADPYGYQNLAGPADDGYSPFLPANGTDLSNVASKGGWNTTCGPPAPAGQVVSTYTYWIWKKALPTAVGEFHIYWDGTGSVMYETGSDSNIGVMIGADALHFGFDHYVSLYDSVTGSGGGAKNVAPSNAGRLWLSVNYIKTKKVWFLSPPPGTTNQPPPQGATICLKRWYIREDGINTAGPGNTLTWTQPGSDASQHNVQRNDGMSGYKNDAPRSHRLKVPYQGDGSFYVKTGTGYTYRWAASIFGIGIQAETNHSSDTWQEDDWGTACRNDQITGRHDCIHWAWGSNMKAEVPFTPKIFYNY